MFKNLPYYIHAFTRLKVDRSKGVAPHKPILLLSIIQGFEEGIIDNNCIFITPELVGFFKSNWNALVTSQHDARFALPFYHMRSEPFWRLVPNPGCEIWVESKSAMKSIGNLQTAVAFAEIDEELANFFKEKNNLDLLRAAILEAYFPNVSGKEYGSGGYLDQLKMEILEDSGVEYKAHLKALQKTMDSADFQEEVFVRGGIFKREVPRIYNNTCCISGFSLSATFNVSMVDACHIIPFSESYDDTISNGIALCPNLHRAFDRGLITIDDEYKVLVSTSFVESESDYSLVKLAGKRILLPSTEIYLPKLANFKWHWENKFKG